MAFQTNVLRDGEWVTETINVNSVLRADALRMANNSRQRAAHPPNCGILTKTALESPVSHWILPVWLRSAQHMDVAVVGDHYVQINELGREGRLRPIIRKTDFGARIRNAKVIGSPPETAALDEEGDDQDVDVKMEDSPFYDSDDNSDDGQIRGLPPQQLLVVLENGDCIFLFVRPGADTQLEFVATQYEPLGHRIVQPGFHAAVDPSSQYMALACAEDLFVVYELESSRNLSNAYDRGEALRPIRTFRPRAVQGVIHKMEFLYPRPADDYHIILLLIVVRNGKSRMVIYDWEAGDDLATVFSQEKKGQLLPPQHQVPLLIVPLTLQSAFFAISDRHIGVCKDVLNPPTDFDDFLMDVQETSQFHHGRGKPIWTAWARPYRLPVYKAARDSIYLAREDGVVMFLDIDSDNILGASVEIGKFDCNIGTSFCSMFDKFNDILIMGGDSGPGTVWQICPRKPNIKLGPIPNWSPVADLVTTDEFTTSSGLVGEKGNTIVSWEDRPPGTFSAPDRVFGTSGRGVTGAVTEFRHGFRAEIGLDMVFETPVKQFWIFPDRTGESCAGYHALLSLVDKSVPLYLTKDLAQGTQAEEDTTAFDEGSRTLAAGELWGNVVIQVTEKCLVFTGRRLSAWHRHSDTFNEAQVTAVDASLYNDLVAVSTHAGSLFCIHLLQLTSSGTVTVLKTFEQTGDVTCLYLTAVGGLPYVVAGIHLDGRSSIVVLKVGENASLDTAPVLVDLGFGNVSRYRASDPQDATGHAADQFEALNSIIVLPQQDAKAAIVFGTRGGEVATLQLDESSRLVAANTEKFGLSPVQLTVVDDKVLGKSVLVRCDGRISLHSELDAARATFRSMKMVWVVDSGNSSKPAPFVDSASVLPGGLPHAKGKTQLILSSKTRLMLAVLRPRPGQVHRTLPLKGTPVKMLYSHVLDCLIVAVKDLQRRTTLQFLDPDTGKDISLATDRNGEPVEFVSGLGKSDDHILAMDEWDYERDGDKWVFLLICTKAGRFIVISTTLIEARPGSKRAAIKYWTRYKKPTFGDAVYAVVASGEDVFSCVGSTVYWDKLNLEAKNLNGHGTYELGSFATSLRIVNGQLVAVTDHDSLEIIDIKGGNTGEMVLHHSDSEFSSAAHAIEMGTVISDGELDTSVLLVSDRASGLVGLWVPWGQPGKDCKAVFEADLPTSVRKLVRGRTRPIWQQTRRDVRYGLVPSTPDAADILGVCLDGSLQHFTMLSPPIWRVLRLVQNLALTSPVLYPFTYEEADEDFDAEPEVDNRSGMQVDGDMLQRCLDRRLLEGLFVKPAHTARLFSLLDKLDNGRWTTAFRRDGPAAEAPSEMHDGEPQETPGGQEAQDAASGKYFALLYDILEYYLAPVI